MELDPVLDLLGKHRDHILGMAGSHDQNVVDQQNTLVVEFFGHNFVDGLGCVVDQGLVMPGVVVDLGGVAQAFLVCVQVVGSSSVGYEMGDMQVNMVENWDNGYRGIVVDYIMDYMDSTRKYDPCHHIYHTVGQALWAQGDILCTRFWCEDHHKLCTMCQVEGDVADQVVIGRVWCFGWNVRFL